MTLDQMRYFMEVAYCGSFSQAARNLYISQPNLTKYIAALEKELGTKLFDRTTRRVSLTENGEIFRTRISRVLMPMIQTMEGIKSELTSHRQPVYIGVGRDETLPEPFLDCLRQQNLSGDDSFLYLMQHDSHIGLSEGLRNQYSLVVSSDRHLRSFSGLSYLPFQRFRMVLAISKYHPLADKPGLSPLDFRNEQVFFSLPSGMSASANLSKNIYYRLGGYVNIKLMPTPSDAIRCAQLCAGAAIVPDVIDLAQYPDVFYVEFDEQGESSPSMQCLIWPEENTNTAPIQTILTALEKHYGQPVTT